MVTLTDDQERELRLLAANLAEFYDLSVEDALAYIRRTVVGDVEPLEHWTGYGPRPPSGVVGPSSDAP